jgi:hypothetical protein
VNANRNIWKWEQLIVSLVILNAKSVWRDSLENALLVLRIKIDLIILILMELVLVFLITPKTLLLDIAVRAPIIVQCAISTAAYNARSALIPLSPIELTTAWWTARAPARTATMVLYLFEIFFIKINIYYC